MADPMTEILGTDNGAQRKVKHNDNFAKRHGYDIRTIDDTDSPYTLLTDDEWVKIDATAGAVTVALEAAADMDGRAFVLEAINVSNTITIEPDGAELINGAANKTIGTVGRAVHLLCDGTAWYAHYLDRLP